MAFLPGPEGLGPFPQACHSSFAVWLGSISSPPMPVLEVTAWPMLRGCGLQYKDKVSHSCSSPSAASVPDTLSLGSPGAGSIWRLLRKTVRVLQGFLFPESECQKREVGREKGSRSGDSQSQADHRPGLPGVLACVLGSQRGPPT